MREFTFFLPTKIVFGRDVVRKAERDWLSARRR